MLVFIEFYSMKIIYFTLNINNEINVVARIKNTQAKKSFQK